MGRRAVGQVAKRARAAERGAILLVALIVSVTFGLLAMALVSTAEVSFRARGNSRDLDAAERAAQSGVEWAAALTKVTGLLAQARSATLDGGVVVTAQVRLLQQPNLLGTGRSNGVEVSVGAEAVMAPDPLPYALASFAGTTVLSKDLTVGGAAYFGAANAPLGGSGVLRIDGDLALVSATAPRSGQVVHSSGVTRGAVASIAAPVWDTLPFATAVGWKVPVVTFLGSTTIKDQAIRGLVVVNLTGGQTLTLDNVRIEGTLVVPCVYPPVLDLLGAPAIEVRDNVTIVGGTADTGNLAVLAPGCKFVSRSGARCLVQGVTYVRQVDLQANALFEGQVLLRMEVLDNKEDGNGFARSVAFRPDVPVGITWPGPDRLRIQWRGRQ